MFSKLFRLKVSRKHIAYIATFLLFKIFLELSYAFSVSQFFSYMGFILEPNYGKLLLSYLVFFIFVFANPKKEKLANILVSLFFGICVVPVLSFYWLADQETAYFFLIALFYFVLLVTIYVFGMIAKRPSFSKNQRLKYSFKKNNVDGLIVCVFIVYAIITLYLGLRRGGIDSRSFSFDTIYSLRSENNETGTINGYLVNWCAKSLFPILTVCFLVIKKRRFALVCVLLQLFLYLCYGYKAYLLSTIATLGIYFLGSVFRPKNGLVVTIFILLTIALLPSFLCNAPGIIGSVSFKIMNTYAMRMMFEPARIEFGYFEFFSNHNKLYFSEGVIGSILGLEYPFSQPIGFVLTKYMLGENVVSNSNTGVIADSYAQLGVAGIVLIALSLGVFLMVLQRCTKKLPIFASAAIFVYPVFMLNDNPFLTNLLTNGLLLDLILIYFISCSFYKKNAKIIKRQKVLLRGNNV